MEMEEEYFPKRGIETRMKNILDSGTKNGKYHPINSRPVNIPIYAL
jgi:hypothetical protein